MLCNKIHSVTRRLVFVSPPVFAHRLSISVVFIDSSESCAGTQKGARRTIALYMQGPFT